MTGPKAQINAKQCVPTVLGAIGFEWYNWENFQNLKLRCCSHTLWFSVADKQQKEVWSSRLQKWLYERFGVYIEDFRFQPEESTVEAEEPLSAKRWVRAAAEQILTFLPRWYRSCGCWRKIKNKNKISRQLDSSRGVRKLSRVVSQQQRLWHKNIFLTVNLLGVELQNCWDVTYLLWFRST